MQKCSTCGGIYDPLLPDGMLYFHACPPVPKLKVLQPGGAIAIVDPPLPAGAVLLQELAMPMPQGRDENVPSTRAQDHGLMKAAGKGITTL